MVDAKEVAQAYFKRALAGDPKLADLFAPDATWWVPEGSPLGGTHCGVHEIFEMLDRAFGVYDRDTMQVDLLDVFGEGERACVRFGVESRTAKGKDWKGEYVALFQVRDGKILAVREYFDTKRVCEVVFA